MKNTNDCKCTAGCKNRVEASARCMARRVVETGTCHATALASALVEMLAELALLSHPDRRPAVDAALATLRPGLVSLFATLKEPGKAS